MKKRRLLWLFMLPLLTGALTSCGNNNKEALTIVHVDQEDLGDAAADLGVSIGIKKGNTVLENQMNMHLNQIDAATRQLWMDDAISRASGNAGTTQVYDLVSDPSAPVLRVGLECDYQPFNWTETSQNDYSVPIKGESNYADGYDIQMARYLTNKMNMRLEIHKLKWDALVPALETNELDAIIAGMTDTAERRQKIDFTKEYYRSELVLIVRKSSYLAEATSLEDFRGAKIVSQVSTVTDKVINDWVEEYDVKHMQALDTFATCSIAVKNGSADAMTAELPVALAICNSSESSSIGENIGYLLKNFWKTFLNGIASTLFLAVGGTFLGLLIGIVVALGRNMTIKEHDSKIVKVLKGFTKGLTSIYVNVFRGTPMMVQAMIIFFGSSIIGISWTDMKSAWIFNGAFWCGFIVIVINTGAYMAEIVRSGLNGVEKGQEEASRSLGMSYWQTMFHVIIPQALKNALPTILNEYIVNVKDSSVLNVIGLTELYASVSIATNMNYFKVEGYIIIAIIYLILTLLATLIVNIINAKLEGRKFTFVMPRGHARANKEAK